MHISEGILSTPVLAGGGVIAAAGVYVGLRSLNDEDIPKTAMMTAVFFTASLVQVPAGPVSMHLVLNGLMGLLLGWSAFPSILIALTLQAVIFRYGGLTVLGVNTLIMACPAVLVHILLSPFLRMAQSRARVLVVGACAGLLGIAGGMAFVALAFVLTGRSMYGVAGLFVVTHIPVLLVEGVFTAAMVSFLWRMKPELIESRSYVT